LLPKIYRSVPLAVLSLALGSTLVAGGGCAGVKQKGAEGSGGATATGGMFGGLAGSIGSIGGAIGSIGGSPVIGPVMCDPAPCTDFPATPIMADGTSPSVVGMFGAPSGGAGPCVTEPEADSLFPINWLRPRIRVAGSTGPLKLTIHADKEANDLVVYFSSESWTMPKDMWTKLASHVVEEDITVTVQAPSGGATTVKFKVAPVGAEGSMVFWAADPSAVGKDPQMSKPTDSTLQGFAVGDESTVTALSTDKIKQQIETQGGGTQGAHCIGCHNATPDGDYVAFVDAWPWGVGFARVAPTSAAKPGAPGDALPGYEGGTCTSWNTCTSPRTFVQYPWGGPMTFSPAHWRTGDKKGIIATQMKDVTMPWSTDNKEVGKLAWVDVEQAAATMTTNGQINPMLGTAFGYLSHTGDLGGAAFPTWSHDGQSIVYASTMGGNQDGRLEMGTTDLYEVPYADGKGGAAKKVGGASSGTAEEYYPSFSPDDQLIAFNSVPKGQEMYANPAAELYVVPHAGATMAARLKANDPPTCTGLKSPGINNHWPKWAPDANASGSRRYYWIIFSSNRYGLPTVSVSAMGTTKIVEVSQLYITGVVVDGSTVETHGAIYLWNQPKTRLNTTPAWEVFHIPPVIVE
jgi:hypothetical protein